ncbi:hypothetical protein KR100_11355 [Synechococcus sp. KORDI-100]|nr:hypothetical protein KR100_11355 [Synechococcus sp. KORDI-100]
METDTYQRVNICLISIDIEQIMLMLRNTFEKLWTRIGIIKFWASTAICLYCQNPGGVFIQLI